jgi:hypothetical protein
MEHKVMRIERVIYWESKDGPRKVGVLVNEGDGPLLDMDGNPVTEIYHYRRPMDQILTILDEDERRKEKAGE